MSDDARTATPYPEHWEADVVLADGGTVHLRPTAPRDTEPLRAMHARMSDRTRYLRYFAAVREVSDQQLSVFTDVDHASSVGLVAVLGAELIAAGTYHRTPGTDQAEVAFVVEDAHQRRGLGSILLEHLAAAAQERGLSRFVAEVLADNPQMLRVFTDAGYAVTREFADGVLEVAFDIAPTEASRTVMYSRERRSEARSIERLMNPTSVAVIGASDDPAKIGHAVLANLLGSGFTGPVYPVHPDARAVQSIRAYPDVGEIPGPVDLAVIAVPAASVAEVVASCQAKGVHGLIVVTAGFAEAGPDGAIAQRSMVARARANGMRVLGPNCLGLINTDPAIRLNASLAPRVPAPGRIGFFCQSGALGIAILADAAQRGLGLSSFASAGNRADVSGNDLMQYWYDDPRTDVVLLYLESFGNPRKFARLARALARRKPVIVLKSGRHAMLTPGLTASSATVSESAVATLFAQSGVMRVDTLSEGFDLALLLSTQPVPAGPRVAVIGNSTALGVLALDACLEQGLTVSGGAPIDLGVSVQPEMLALAVRTAVEDPAVDAVVVVYVPPVAIPGQQHAAALRSAVAGARKPVVSTFLAVQGLPEQLAVRDPDVRLTARGGTAPAGRGSVPSFSTPERAVAALARATRYGAWCTRPGGVLVRPDGIDEARARRLVDRWRAADPAEHELPVDRRVELLACYGISVLEYRVARSAAAAVTGAGDIGYPVVVKVADETFRHRDDGIGVRVGLTDPEQVARAYAELAALGDPTCYVQAMASRDRATVSTVCGIRADPSFGALVWFGLGGMATELLDDRAYRAVPLTDTDAADLIDAPRAAPLLRGYRGSAPVATPALQDLALRLSALADDLPEIIELTLRPVLVGPAGLSVTGTAGRLGPPPRYLDATRRMR